MMSRSSGRRELGRYGAAAPGSATLIVVGGLHGNEPAGVLAAQRVLDHLVERDRPLPGRLIALAGNLAALATGRRFIDHDFNRSWTAERLATATAPAESTPTGEDRELRELLGSLTDIVRSSTGPVYVIDMHTTSSVSAPFMLFADTLRNRAFARCFPLPMVLGLDEQIDGTMLNHLNEIGCICLGVEGGQHDDPASVDNLEALLWIALVAVGGLARADAPDLAGCRDRLRRSHGTVPAVVEVRYRHAIQPADAFAMAPGFVNFQPVGAGQLLAHDRRGSVVAPEAGRILMPLYQGQGDDGFFMTRSVDPRWLAVSAILRRMRLDRLLPLLPGVRHHPARPHALAVNTRVARWFPLDVFHLFGYYRVCVEGSELVVGRRGNGG